MKLVDARRLTGKNLLGPNPLVIVELSLDPGESLEQARAAYLAELRRVLGAVSVPGSLSSTTPLVELERGLVSGGMGEDPSLVTRAHQGGAVFGYRAPLDTMLAHTEAAEWAAESAASVLATGAPLSLEPKRTEIGALFAAQRNPAFLGLRDECAARGVPFCWDDTHATCGEGASSHTVALEALGHDAGHALKTSVPWDAIGRIPTAMVTGTNGKTTSSRLLARIAREAGHVVGLTSSDGALVDDEVLAAGDFTGPAAARLVLRDLRVTLAVLETARGGILRRGLAVDACDVALLTNVSADHLGGYGVDELTDMVRVKAVVAAAARHAVILNAADPSLRDLAPTLGSAASSSSAGSATVDSFATPRVTFFADLESRPELAPFLAAHRANGGRVVFTRDGQFVRAEGEREVEIFPVSRAPVTFFGAARYNVENALGALGAAWALGLPDVALARGLERFGPRENPGRGELFEIDGVRIVLDFAHNAEGVRALGGLLSKLRDLSKGRLTLVAGSPGDRSNEDILELARAVVEARPDQVLVRELAHYLRGRALGEVPELFRSVVVPTGIPFAVVDTEVAALDTALATARPGDLIAVFAHVDREEVAARLAGQK